MDTTATDITPMDTTPMDTTHDNNNQVLVNTAPLVITYDHFKAAFDAGEASKYTLMPIKMTQADVRRIHGKSRAGIALTKDKTAVASILITPTRVASSDQYLQDEWVNSEGMHMRVYDQTVYNNLNEEEFRDCVFVFSGEMNTNASPHKNNTVLYNAIAAKKTIPCHAYVPRTSTYKFLGYLYPFARRVSAITYNGYSINREMFYFSKVINID